MWDFRDKFFAVGVVRPHVTHSCAGLGCREAPLTLVEGQGRRFGIVSSSDWGGFGLCCLNPLQQQPGSPFEHLHGLQQQAEAFFAALPPWQACQNSSRSVPVNRQKY